MSKARGKATQWTEVLWSIALVFIMLSMAADADAITTWARRYGSATYPYDQVPGERTRDGGIITGHVYNYGEPVPYTWLVKLQANGDIEWQKRYDSIYVRSAIQTDDGFIVVGGIGIIDAGTMDRWVAKLNNSGDIQWQYTYELPGYDLATTVYQTADGGYVVGGTNPGVGGGSVVLKLYSSGAIEWQKMYDAGDFRAIRQTADGGYIVAAGTYASGQFELVKLDPAGIIEWQSRGGGSNADALYSVEQTTDGGYIAAGTGTTNYLGPLLVKYSSTGSVEWYKNYYGGEQGLKSVLQTSDGGYIATGNGITRAMVVKVDQSGEVLWVKSYDDMGSDGYSIVQALDSGYFLLGVSSGLMVLKLDADANLYGCFAEKIYSGPGTATTPGFPFSNPITAIRPIETASTVATIVPAETFATSAAPCAETWPVISVNPAALYFSGVGVKTVSITNFGQADLSLTGITIPGTDFTQTNDCTTLVTNAACNITVTFAPGSSGSKQASLDVSSNDPTYPTRTVALSGNVLNQYTLSVSKSGTGTGIVTSAPSGINCGATCSALFDYPTSVTLTAAATSDSFFAGWSGAGCSGTGTCVTTMDADKTVSAAFTQYITVTVPNGGETWTKGTTYTIRWNYAGSPGSNVKIELLKNGALNRTITSSTSIGSGGSGSYNWKVPNNQTTGTDYKIRVTSTSNSNYKDTSNANFTIQ
jgi:hypothetical protein